MSVPQQENDEAPLCKREYTAAAALWQVAGNTIHSYEANTSISAGLMAAPMLPNKTSQLHKGKTPVWWHGDAQVIPVREHTRISTEHGTPKARHTTTTKRDNQETKVKKVRRSEQLRV